MLGRTVCFLIIAATLRADAGLHMIQGCPVADGVFINGHGPYRFLVDTGAQTNQIGLKLARSIGLQPSFELELATPKGTALLPGGRGIEVTFGSARRGNQEFLFSDLRVVRQLSTDVQGVLGEEFLGHFDYLLDLKNHRLEFGDFEPEGIRVNFRRMEGRPSIFTSLGWLVLDSGANHLLLFRGVPAIAVGLLWTAAGRSRVGVSELKSMTIEAQTVARTGAVVVPLQDGRQEDGLIPESYVTLECSNCFEQKREQRGKVVKQNSTSRKGT